MRKFAKLVFWTLVAMVLPAVAFAQDGGASGAGIEAIALMEEGASTTSRIGMSFENGDLETFA